MQRPGRRAFLQTQTRNLHQALDEAIGAFDLTTAHDYGAYLQAVAAAHLPLEELLQISGVQRLMTDWQQRRRHCELLQDLASLGLAAPAIPPQLPADDARLFGVLYVLEGSRLGAQVLLQRVLHSAESGVRSATRYLQANEAARLWRSFLERLETDPLAGDLDSLAAGARFAFTKFLESIQSRLGAANLTTA